MFHSSLTYGTILDPDDENYISPIYMAKTDHASVYRPQIVAFQSTIINQRCSSGAAILMFLNEAENTKENGGISLPQLLYRFGIIPG